MYLPPDPLYRGCCKTKSDSYQACKSASGTLTWDYCKQTCSNDNGCLGYFYDPRYSTSASNACWIATDTLPCPTNFTLEQSTKGHTGNIIGTGTCGSEYVTGCYRKLSKIEPLNHPSAYNNAIICSNYSIYQMYAYTDYSIPFQYRTYFPKYIYLSP